MHLSSRVVFAALAVLSLGLLGGALVLGELAQIHPCYLCNFQRLEYMIVALFALCGALLPCWRQLWSGLVGLVAAGGAATALQQSWMQFAPDQAIECGFGDPTLLERIVDWLGVQWPAMFMVTGFCTAKDWVFLGLSLANWSALGFFVLFFVALRLCCRRA